MDLNWNVILQAMSYKLQQLEEEVMICHACEQYVNEIDAAEAELSEYKKEYERVLIAQQESNNTSKGIFNLSNIFISDNMLKEFIILSKDGEELDRCFLDETYTLWLGHTDGEEAIQVYDKYGLYELACCYSFKKVKEGEIFNE